MPLPLNQHIHDMGHLKAAHFHFHQVMAARKLPRRLRAHRLESLGLQNSIRRAKPFFAHNIQFIAKHLQTMIFP